VQHQVDVRERLEPGAEPGLGPAHPLGHGADPPAGTAEDGDDPVRLAQLLRPQHDPVIPVELHLLILPYAGDNPGRARLGLAGDDVLRGGGGGDGGAERGGAARARSGGEVGAAAA